MNVYGLPVDVTLATVAVAVKPSIVVVKLVPAAGGKPQTTENVPTVMPPEVDTVTVAAKRKHKFRLAELSGAMTEAVAATEAKQASAEDATGVSVIKSPLQEEQSLESSDAL